MISGQALVSGIFERIGESQSKLTHHYADAAGAEKQAVIDQQVKNHRAAFDLIFKVFQRENSTIEFTSIGHRVVHGGEHFHEPVLITKSILEVIRQLSVLAPLHNPANITGIEECLDLFSHIPQIAVFDTAFHQTMPAYAFRYAIPASWYTAYHVRRYGFHGTSHAYIAKLAAARLKKLLTETNLITLHLGNGASVAAIKNGISIDTSMGLTPLEGLIMGTRCGDIDPAIPYYISYITGEDSKAIDDQLNKDSGLKGICGVNDMREIQRLAASGNRNAQLAIDMYCYRIIKYIGAYYAVLQQVHALVFTAGIGENSALIRQKICAGLEGLDVYIDEEKNTRANGDFSEIQADNSRFKVFVVRTNEELEIANQTLNCLSHN